MFLFDFFRTIKIKSSALTDKGKKRQHNEDSILVDEKNALYVVADGIGGHKNGAYASSETLKILQQYLFSEKSPESSHELISQVNFENASDINSQGYPEINKLFHAIEKANNTIFNINFEEQQKAEAPQNRRNRMGTTLVGCWFLPKRKRAIIFNVGDSRVYLARDNQLIQRTHDHSAIQMWRDNGQQGPEPNANKIIRAIGPVKNTQPDIELVEIKRGDTWLICSDGLHGMLSDEEIAEFILPRIENKKLANYQNFSQRLVDKANYAGGRDNVSIILAHVV